MKDKTTESAGWEVQLDSLDARERARAIEAFRKDADTIRRAAPPRFQPGNLHGHSFYSFNCYGYSPTRYALLARRFGMDVAGLVDFDVLDGLDEFHAAGRLLDLRTVVSIETRVSVPEFATRVINSPGEPGIAYHMACGFAQTPDNPRTAAFLHDLRERSARRNRAVVERVNPFLDPAVIDPDDVARALTPSGNATERHLVLAYARKAAAVIGADGLLAFWTKKLGPGLETRDLPESPKLLNLIRAKTMKAGGPGYVAPTPDSFPALADFNQWAVRAGAIPTVAWLDGTSAGEQAMQEYCALAAESGAAALNIIPDRNFTPGVVDQKLRHLRDVVVLAESLHWPVIAGTEMNSPGQRFVDQFDTAELRPLVPVFQRGARVLYAHTALQRAAGIGYLGSWADRHLPRREDRLGWFAELGGQLTPSTEPALQGISAADTPDAIRGRI
ncbi:MAG TPA: hypothetical protein PKE12_01285 [Kiritimatiellia bacterium]|nr:hypothetical protein [Kiritimatiellia bacterium]